MLWACLPLKKRIFDPLLPKRLAEFGIGSNTPCVPWRHGGGYTLVDMIGCGYDCGHAYLIFYTSQFIANSSGHGNGYDYGSGNDYGNGY